MENQIQLYHDATAFWLDKEWKTPREKELEGEVAGLKEENARLSEVNELLDEELEREKQGGEELEREIARLKSHNTTLRRMVGHLQEELEPLQLFKDIPCCYCGKPIEVWKRRQILQAFKNWCHAGCKKTSSSEPLLTIIDGT